MQDTQSEKPFGKCIDARKKRSKKKNYRRRLIGGGQEPPQPVDVSKYTIDANL